MLPYTLLSSLTVMLIFSLKWKSKRIIIENKIFKISKDSFQMKIHFSNVLRHLIMLRLAAHVVLQMLVTHHALLDLWKYNFIKVSIPVVCEHEKRHIFLFLNLIQYIVLNFRVSVDDFFEVIFNVGSNRSFTFHFLEQEDENKTSNSLPSES